MKALVLKGKRKLSIEERPKPEIKQSNQVLIKMKSVGICGSDLHWYREGGFGVTLIENPVIIGHEGAGEIVEVGRGVRKIKIGDKVAVEPTISCGRCEFCKIGRYNLCPDVKCLALPPTDGALAEYLVHPESSVYRLPQTLDFEDGALVEPTSVGLHALDLVDLKPGNKILILGAGPIGIVILLLAKICGLRIAISDINNFRLKIAKDIGAELVINSKEKNLMEMINLWTEGKGVEICFEAVGISETTNLAIAVTKASGTIVGIGLDYQENPALDILKIITKEIKFQGLQRYCHTYPRIIELLACGKLSLKKLITHRFPFEKAIEAFEFALTEKEKSLKVMINF